jgi:hypothetical protein
MHCPRCGGEFRDGIERCSDCGVGLLPGEPTRESDLWLAEPPPDPVTVYTARDAADLAVARSLLESEAIPHFVRGEGVQDLLGIGRLGAGFNPLVGLGEIEVPASAAGRARALLSDPDAPPEEEGDEDRAGGEAMPDDPYAIPRRPAGAMEAQALRAAPTSLDRRRFRSLVLGFLAAHLASWFYNPRWSREIPDDLYLQLESYFGANDLSRTVDSFHWLALPAGVVIAGGLLGFSRAARNLFVAFWILKGASYLLGGPGFAGGLGSTLVFLAELLGGAVLALAFYGPVAAAFETAPPDRRPKASRPIRRPPRPPAPTSPG